MLDVIDILKRFTSRLLIGFIFTIWACANYHEIVNPWIFVTSFGVFVIAYGAVKICSYYTGNTNGEVNENIRNEIVNEDGTFKSAEIRG